MKIWNLGYPRVGRKRELKKALESYWAKQTSLNELLTSAERLCATRWARQHELGVESIPVNDFSFYDHVLDTSYLLGAVPDRFNQVPRTHWLDLYFAMARGYRDAKQNVAPLDMTKWFNTNYHYLVPEIDSRTKFGLQLDKLNFELEHCRSYPYPFHPVLLGPWTFLKLSQLNGVSIGDALERLVPVYSELLAELLRRRFEWVQIDEPYLACDSVREDIKGVRQIYEQLAQKSPHILLTTYFETPDPWLSELVTFPVSGLHLDLVSGNENQEWLRTKAYSREKVLSLGVVNGRNLWAAPLTEIRKNLNELIEMYPTNKIWLAPSCSLLHLPHDKKLEKSWDNEFSSWISFADQRLEELSILKRAFTGDKSVEPIFKEREEALAKRAVSPRVHRPEVKQAVGRLDASMKTRKSEFSRRIRLQNQTLKLPPLPTTTIGSFPQTESIRKHRLDVKKGRITEEQYQWFMNEEIQKVVELQEKLDIDVLVHGEPERNDMVEYFGELLEGFTFSDNGWVQSYGSRCVKPPILFGDVKRKAPMTVEWWRYAQGLTKKPMKGMLTGPVTILNWSFVREDQPREKTSYQVALAIREEVQDLERAGAKIIQIDEAALREGLPIKHRHWNNYLRWATDSFRICSSGVKDETQIQTHMCYSEFGDIMEAISRLDADVLLIEFARSGESFLDCFRKYTYKNNIGPGVYDIHSPRIPTEDECAVAIQQLLELFPVEKVWINPDCGLKTRKYDEVEPALRSMVAGAKRVREQILKLGS